MLVTDMPIASQRLRLPITSRRARLFLGVAVSLSWACATYSDRTEAARAAMQAGKLDETLSQFNKILEVKSSETLPDKLKKNWALVILERATVLQAHGQYPLSSRDFEFADKELEMLDISRDTAGKIGQYVFSDSSPKYKTSPTEKLSLNAMNLCNYLVQRDLNGANIEARRFTVMRNYFRDTDPEHEHGAFGSYLAGFVHERLGNTDEALRYYGEALQERDFETLRAVIPPLAERGSYRNQRINAYLPAEQHSTRIAPTTPLATAPTSRGMWALEPGPSGEGDLVVIAKVGRVPYKIPQRIPIGAAIGLAGAFITGDTRILEYSMFKVVSYPELVDSGDMFSTAQMRLDGQAMTVDLATDLAAEITAEYEQLKPKIIGAALSRMIVRAVAAESARAATKASDHEAAGLLGFLAAAAIEGSMVAADKPDTRSWTTLPANVYIGRQRVAPGHHTVAVNLSGAGGGEQRTFEFTMDPGGFVVLDVTTLR